MTRPNLKLVSTEEDTTQYTDYRDWLRMNRKSLEWKIERTKKNPGDVEIGRRG